MEQHKLRYYENNKDKWLAWNRASKRRAREALSNAKLVPCVDCGQSFPPYVMDFDHLGDKVTNLAKMASNGVGLAKLQAEMDKCEVVCANCHRIRTHERSARRPS
jgi:hypothetical protein